MQGRLDIGGVIRRVFDIYLDQAPVLMPAAAVVFVFTGIIAELLIAANGSLAVLALLIDLVATTLFTGMIVELVADVRDGRRDATVSQLLSGVMPVFGQLVFVGVIAGVAVLAGFILLIIPGLILLTIWAVFAPVIVLEHPPGLKALGRSRELVRGNGWRVFGVICVFIVLVVVVADVIEVAADSAGTGAGIVARVVVGVLTAPLSALAAAVLYFELRDNRPSSGFAPGSAEDGPLAGSEGPSAGGEGSLAGGEGAPGGSEGPSAGGEGSLAGGEGAPGASEGTVPPPSP